MPVVIYILIAAIFVVFKEGGNEGKKGRIEGGRKEGKEGGEKSFN